MICSLTVIYSANTKYVLKSTLMNLVQISLSITYSKTVWNNGRKSLPCHKEGAASRSTRTKGVTLTPALPVTDTTLRETMIVMEVQVTIYSKDSWKTIACNQVSIVLSVIVWL